MQKWRADSVFGLLSGSFSSQPMFPEINFKIEKLLKALSFIFLSVVFQLATSIKPVAVIKDLCVNCLKAAHCETGSLPNTSVCMWLEIAKYLCNVASAAKVTGCHQKSHWQCVTCLQWKGDSRLYLNDIFWILSFIAAQLVAQTSFFHWELTVKPDWYFCIRMLWSVHAAVPKLIFKHLQSLCAPVGARIDHKEPTSRRDALIQLFFRTSTSTCIWKNILWFQLLKCEYLLLFSVLVTL